MGDKGKKDINKKSSNILVKRNVRRRPSLKAGKGQTENQ